MQVEDISSLGFIVQGLFPCLLSALLLIFFIYFDNSLTRKTQILFMTGTCFMLLLSISEGFDYYFQLEHINYKVRSYLAAISYTCRICCVGFTVAISLRTHSKNMILIYVVMIINALAAIISIKTGCIFSISEEHLWTKGPLYFLPYACILYYMILMLFSLLNKLYSNFWESIILCGCFILCITGNMLELFVKWKLILSAAFILSILFYFLCVNVQLYRRDAMTTLLNRRSFFMDAKRFADKNFIVLSMDLNDLKYQNDCFGHEAGDRAICTTGLCMQQAFKKAGKVYRIGGDEFMAVFPEKSINDIESLINLFKTKLSKTEYKVACGYALHTPGKEIEEVMEIADKEMYANKRELKGADGVIR